MRFLIVFMLLLPSLALAQRSSVFSKDSIKRGGGNSNSNGNNGNGGGSPTGQCCNPAGQLVPGNPHQTNCGFNNGVFYPAQNGQCFAESSCCKRRSRHNNVFVNCVLPENECRASSLCSWVPGCGGSGSTGGSTGSSTGGTTGGSLGGGAVSGVCCQAKPNGIPYDCSQPIMNFGHPQGLYYAQQRCVQVNQGNSCQWNSTNAKCRVQEPTSGSDGCVEPKYFMNYTTIPQTSSEYARCKELAGTGQLVNNMCCVDPSKL